MLFPSFIDFLYFLYIIKYIYLSILLIMTDSWLKTITVELSDTPTIIDGKEHKSGISYIRDYVYINATKATLDLFCKFRDEAQSPKKFEFETTMNSVQLLTYHPLVKKLKAKSGWSGVLGHIEKFTIPSNKADELITLLTIDKDKLLHAE